MYVEVVCKAPCFTCGVSRPYGVPTAVFSKAVGKGAGGREMAKGRDGSGSPGAFPNYDTSAFHLYVYTRTYAHVHIIGNTLKVQARGNPLYLDSFLLSFTSFSVIF